MIVKELIQKLQSFDGEHPVVVQSEDKKNWNTGDTILDVKFNRYCVIVTEDNE